jgi:hypothetical protein
LREALTPVARSVPTTTPPVSDRQTRTDDEDDQNRQVSAEDLL